MKKNNIALYVDLLFCLIIMPLAIMLLPVNHWIDNNKAFFFALVAYIYVLYFVYRTACIPKLFIQKKYLQILVLLAVLLSLTLLLTYFPVPAERITDDIMHMEARMNMRRQTIWFFFLIVTGFSLAIELIFELFRQMLSRQEAETEKNKAELALYKAQINPHFLFNTLNTLYALLISGSDKTESAFIKFSGILRYMYTQSCSDMIPIESELEYIRQYVDLQKLRLNNHSQINMTIETKKEGVLIPPMILITFVENVFKYGTSSDTDCKVHIHIRVDADLLHMETENSIMSRRKDGMRGIGIKNCRKRLELLYPGRFVLLTGELDGKYKTLLNIRLR